MKPSRHSPKPLRVALITRSLRMGGAQQHILKLCRAVSPEEVNLHLFLLVNGESNELLPYLPDNFPVHIAPIKHSNPLILKWIADALKSYDIQVAQSFLWTADAISSLSRRIFHRIPLICSERGDRSWVSYYNSIHNLYDRLITFQTANRICANSMYGKDVLINKGCTASRIEVIPNGVELDYVDSLPAVNLRKELRWPEECVIVGHVSRLVDIKGVAILIRALARLPEDLCVRCAIIGDGPQRAALEDLAKALGVGERVAFLGQLSPSISFTRGFDIGTLATTMEHCSNSILEYMSCGLAVIATRVGGNPELVFHEKTGILVEPNDDVQMSRAIQNLATNPTLRRELGRQGRSRVECEYRMDIIMDRFIGLWRSVARS